MGKIEKICQKQEQGDLWKEEIWKVRSQIVQLP